MGLAIATRDAAFAGFDAAAGDREAEAGAAGFAVASGFGAKEGVEDGGHRFFRDAGAVIGHGELDAVGVAVGGDADRAIGRGVADGVADQVREGAEEVLFVAFDLEVRVDCDFDFGTGAGGLGIYGAL